MARFRLMNKDYPVLEFEYDSELHAATRITEVLDVAHAPLGLFDERGQVSKRDLNYWWRHRAIPASREQVERLLENLRLDSTLELAERNFGLSLSATAGSFAVATMKPARHAPLKKSRRPNDAPLFIIDSSCPCAATSPAAGSLR